MKISGSLAHFLTRIGGILLWACTPFMIMAVPAGLEAEDCTVHWIDSNGGSWTDGQNWDTGNPPAATDDVCITLDGAYTVSMTSNVNVQSLILGTSSNGWAQTLQIGSGQSLSVHDWVAVFDSGYLAMGSDAALSGDAGAILQSAGEVGLNGAQIEVDFDNYGDLYFAGTCQIQSNLNNQNGAWILPFDGTTGGDFQLNNGMNNSGTIYLASEDSLTITILGGQLENEVGGLIKADLSSQKGDNIRPRAGTTPPRIIGLLLNEGDLWVGASGLILSGDGLSSSNALSGNIELVGGSLQMDLTGDGSSRAASSFTNLGSIDIGTGLSFDVSTAGGKSGGRAASSFTNLGSIDIGTGGGFSISEVAKGSRAASSFTNLGSIDIGVGAAFVCEGVDFTNEQDTRAGEGIISGSGLLDLESAASVRNRASIRPGASGGISTIGTLTISGSMVQESSASLLFDLAGPSTGSNFDKVVFTDAMQKVGRIELDLVGGFVPVEGDNYEIMTYGGAEGSYASNTVFPSLDGGLGWELHESQSHTVAEVVCEEGDNLRILSVDLDKDPVSEGSVLTLDILSDSVGGNSNVILSIDLGLYLDLEEVLVGECDMEEEPILDCRLDDPGAGHQSEIVISVIPLISGDLTVPISLSGDICETWNPDNTTNITVHAITAAPCDANNDSVIDQYDLPVAAAHFFGSTAPGNPDCSDDGILNAQDISLINIYSGD